LVIVVPTNCLTTWKTLHTSQHLYLSELISHYLPPRCLLAFFQYKSPYHTSRDVLLATFPLRPFLCLHLLLIGTLYLHIFVLSIPYPPLNATLNSISSPVCLYRLVILCQRLRFVITILTLYKIVYNWYVLYVCMFAYTIIHSHSRTIH